MFSSFLLYSPIIVIKIRSPRITVIKDIKTYSSVLFFSSFTSIEFKLMLVTLYMKVSFRYVEFKRSMKNSGLLSIETNPIMSEKSNEDLIIKQ